MACLHVCIGTYFTQKDMNDIVYRYKILYKGIMALEYIIRFHNYDSVCLYINLKPSTPVSSLFSKKSVLNIRPNGWTFAENN